MLSPALPLSFSGHEEPDSTDPAKAGSVPEALGSEVCITAAGVDQKPYPPIGAT